ncbi:OmpA-OmpF porin, OOP family [Massilia sp. PDC64]|nr:porin family protein [Massilia sp. PDC64]SDE62246.1 OmpA-OmpF porin, OOP family [Massilia sp. PDC64]
MKKLLLALIATSAVAGAAQAQTTTPHAYVGIGAATADNKSTDDYKTSAKIYGGYEFDQNWGVEAGYTNFDKQDIPGGNVKGSGTYVAGKYSLPLGERFTGYGKLGVSYNERKLSSNTLGQVNSYDTGLYGGVGVEYKLNQNLALNAEYERYGKDKALGAKADVYTVGLKYGF